MLRTGLNRNLVEGESEVIPAGKRKEKGSAGASTVVAVVKTMGGVAATTTTMGGGVGVATTMAAGFGLQLAGLGFATEPRR